MSEKRLGQLEQAVLAAIIHLPKDERYGMKIQREIKQRTARNLSVGAVYTTLARLEEKKFVSSRRGEPTPERGGKAKLYFRVTAPGHRALDRSRQLAQQMFAGLPAGV